MDISPADLACLSRLLGEEGARERVIGFPENARATLDALSQIAANPQGFTLATDALPCSDRPVLALRRSGYTCAEFEVLTARYMPNYRPQNPWQTIGCDAVTDSGEPVLAWRSADELLRR